MAAEDKPLKRRCVSTACTACRRRKSKCDGNRPSCACCSSVYLTECVYDFGSDRRRKGMSGNDIDLLRARNTTLKVLIQAILRYDENEAIDLLRQIRACDSLEDVAESITAGDEKPFGFAPAEEMSESRIDLTVNPGRFEYELAGKMSKIFLDGSRKLIGTTSNLSFLPPCSELYKESIAPTDDASRSPDVNAATVKRWTLATEDASLIRHLMRMYFTWHYPFYTVLAKGPFLRDFVHGIPGAYCSSLLVNSILALGCHFSSWQGAFENPQDPSTAGNHFFKEAKRLALEGGEYETSSLCNVQAFALMSVREAGCGREGKGWVYSGLSLRMALDLGLNVDPANFGSQESKNEEIDARRITFWGCYMIDKCWSNYLGRQPQLSFSDASTLKFDILAREETDLWSPYTDIGLGPKHAQPSRLRTVALQISTLCEISGDIIVYFHQPADKEQPVPRQSELKKLGNVHSRLETWKRNLPKGLEEKDGQLPQVLVMHMFYHLLLIHLYRHFLKYTKSNTPLPGHVSPRRLCTHAALAISELLRMYKRSYGFRRICNIAVYITHTACAVHFLNLPDETAQKDSMCCLESLEEMAEGWANARRSIRILDISSKMWQVELPSEASLVFDRVYSRWGCWGSWNQEASLLIPQSSLVVTDEVSFSVTSADGVSSSESRLTRASPVKHSTFTNDTIPTCPINNNQDPATSAALAFTPSMLTPSMLTTSQLTKIQPQNPDLALSAPTHFRHSIGACNQFSGPSAYSPVMFDCSNLWEEKENCQIHPGHPSFFSATTSSCHDAENTTLEREGWWSRQAPVLDTCLGNWGYWMDSDFACEPSRLQCNEVDPSPAPSGRQIYAPTLELSSSCVMNPFDVR